MPNTFCLQITKTTPKSNFCFCKAIFALSLSLSSLNFFKVIQKEPDKMPQLGQINVTNILLLCAKKVVKNYILGHFFPDFCKAFSTSFCTAILAHKDAKSS